MVITSVNNSKIKEIRKLRDKKYRVGAKMFLVEGEHLVSEAYKCGLLREVIVTDGIDLNYQVPMTYVTDEVMKSISELITPCGVIGVCIEMPTKDIVGEKILILDRVQDPGNLGTIIRSAVAFNVDTIVLCDCVSLYNDKTIRSTQGCMFHINVVEGRINETIDRVRNRGIPIYATSVSNGEDLKDMGYMDRFALIMGNEGSGLSDEVIDMCDNTINIRMNKSVESLNVAVSCSIILYTIGVR